MMTPLDEDVFSAVERSLSRFRPSRHKSTIMSKSKVDLVAITPPSTPRTNADESSDSERSPSASGSFHHDEIVVSVGLDEERPPLSIILTVKGIVISLVIVVILGFMVGTVARNHPLLDSSSATTKHAAYPYKSYSADDRSMEQTTSPQLRPSIQLVNDSEEATHTNNEIDDDEDDNEPLPSGQQLMIDMTDVDITFLSSKERIATTMVKFINEDTKFILRSHHCSIDEGGGVTCFGMFDV